MLMRPEALPVPEVPLEAPTPPDNPEGSTDAPRGKAMPPPSTVLVLHTLATAVDDAVIRAAAHDAADPLLGSVDAGRSVLGPSGGTVALDLRFFSSFSFRGLGCSTPVLFIYPSNLFEYADHGCWML